jgi:hypothetical protein
MIRIALSSIARQRAIRECGVLGSVEDQLTRAALSTRGAPKTKFLSVALPSGQNKHLRPGHGS